MEQYGPPKGRPSPRRAVSRGMFIPSEIARPADYSPDPHQSSMRRPYNDGFSGIHGMSATYIVRASERAPGQVGHADEMANSSLRLGVSACHRMHLGFPTPYARPVFSHKRDTATDIMPIAVPTGITRNQLSAGRRIGVGRWRHWCSLAGGTPAPQVATEQQEWQPDGRPDG